MEQLIDSGKDRMLGKGTYIPSDYRHSPFMGDRKHTDNIKSTGNAIIIKLNNTYDISMITIGVNDLYESNKGIKEVNIYTNNKLTSDPLGTDCLIYVLINLKFSSILDLQNYKYD